MRRYFSILLLLLFSLTAQADERENIYLGAFGYWTNLKSKPDSRENDYTNTVRSWVAENKALLLSQGWHETGGIALGLGEHIKLKSINFDGYQSFGMFRIQNSWHQIEPSFDEQRRSLVTVQVSYIELGQTAGRVQNRKTSSEAHNRKFTKLEILRMETEDATSVALWSHNPTVEDLLVEYQKALKLALDVLRPKLQPIEKLRSDAEINYIPVTVDSVKIHNDAAQKLQFLSAEKGLDIEAEDAKEQPVISTMSNALTLQAYQRLLDSARVGNIPKRIFLLPPYQSASKALLDEDFRATWEHFQKGEHAAIFPEAVDVVALCESSDKGMDPKKLKNAIFAYKAKALIRDAVQHLTSKKTYQVRLEYSASSIGNIQIFRGDGYEKLYPISDKSKRTIRTSAEVDRKDAFPRIFYEKTPISDTYTLFLAVQTTLNKTMDGMIKQLPEVVQWHRSNSEKVGELCK